MGFFSKLFGKREPDARAAEASDTGTSKPAAGTARANAGEAANTQKNKPSGKVACPNCSGTGRVFASMSMVTGEVTYRTCGQCGGKGSVEAKRAHYTTYPNKSLEIARQLILEHGKVQKASLEDDGHRFTDVTLFFADGYEALLGGFAVGYKGTRPDYLRDTLRAAGFHFTEEDIESMTLPVYLPAEAQNE